MKNWAIGWACTLNEVFVRFPFEKIKSVIGYTHEKRNVVKRVFKECVCQVVDDIIENNATFRITNAKYNAIGEIHLEGIRDEDFYRAKKNGKFKGVDFLQSLFTGYQLYFYIKRKKENTYRGRKIKMYMSKQFRDKLLNYTNQGKQYC